ncbi:FxSxx-COOH system tetratricopeptide repeat protein [Embleya scabrispora]|uniref:FxSxx-COOH system tetratricopeptide repeat protein n=1 Tax=Embleya scabrispora TaxID=159449 RepID=UPI000379312F|nr:FxSxx-COOH system tetratricopeptide repeat protein [Embleya scabrispora]MYS84223.1 tetratricopeptide repeat protein [Streptomyces sp. SID5474]
MSDNPPGTVVTFYSYKGGTGRTMALANVAWILASRGKRVLVVDWDLESPGLHRYFHPYLIDKRLEDTRGVLDMIRAFAKVVGTPASTDAMIEASRDAESRVDGCAVKVDRDFADGGLIRFLGPGRQNHEYAATLAGFNWADFCESPHGIGFLDALREDMRASYDYALIDSRTGLNDIAGICTTLLPDVVVDGFTLNEQAIDGGVNVARSIARQADRPLRILPVPMRVEDDEKDKLEAGRDHARERFAEFLADRSEAERTKYWGEVEIPYKAFYAYEETLATLGDRPLQEGSLLSAYERLTGVLTDGAIIRLDPIDEVDRRRELRRFERVRYTAPVTVRILYSARDRMWVDWVRAQLTASGAQVVGTGGCDTSIEDLQNVDSVVVVSSSHSLPSRSWTAMRTALRRLAAVDQASVVTLRVDDLIDSDPGVGETVTLTALSEDQCRTVLLTAFGRTPTDAVPADGPRFPGTKPKVSQLLPRHPAFTGRDDILERLRDQLAKGATAVLPQALHGLGGVGKTQVALEYAHRFAADYDVIWWVSAEQAQGVAAQLARLGDRLDLPSGENVTDAAAGVLQTLQQGEPYDRWLVIYDNADEPASVAHLMPQGSVNGHVLVTSRNDLWARSARPLEVPVFRRDESVALLQRRVPSLTEADAQKVATALGDLPLAVEQAGAWLAESAMQVEEYLERVSTRVTAILDEGQPPDYPTTAAATWTVSLDELKERQPAAVRLLELCAYLSPDSISMRLLRSREVLQELVRVDSSLGDTLLLSRIFQQLGRYALARVDRGEDTIQVHRLVQAVLRDQMPPEENAARRARVLEILAANAPGDVDDPANQETYEELYKHLVPSRALESDSESVRRWIVEQVRFAWRFNDWEFGQYIAEIALDRWRSRFSRHDALTLRMCTQLANVYRSQGKYRKAYDLDRATLEAQRESLGPDHPHTLITGRGYGGDLRSLGRFHTALESDRDNYTRFSEVFGEDANDTLLAANNLGVSLRLMGLLEEAREVHQEAFDRRRRIQGDDHSRTCFLANEVGHDLRELGDYAGSRAVLQQTLAREEAMGRTRDALRTAKNLAVTIRQTGDARYARSLDSDTLEKYRAYLGPTHPVLLSCTVNLAADNHAMGNDEAALDLAQEAYQGYREQFGAQHPFTFGCASNLSIYLRAVGRDEEAMAIGLRSLEGLRELLGEDHPYTLAAALNHANNLYQAGQANECADLDRVTYDRYEALLGADHPHTLVAACNRVQSLGEIGLRDESREWFTRTERACRRKLGDEHPITQGLRARRRLETDIEVPAA